MPADFHFYEDAFTILNTALTGYWEDVAVTIVDAITPVATTLLGIYFVLWGWAMMRGVISEPVADGLGRIIRLAIILGLALSVTRYGGFIANALWESPEVLASYITTGSSDNGSNMQFLDRLMSKIFDLGDAFWQNANARSGFLTIPDFGQIILVLLIWAAGVIATGYTAFLLVLSKMALAILLGVGPLFILMTVFEPTKRFFDAWIGQALNYVFLVMLTAAALRLILTIIETYLTSAAEFGVLANPKIPQALPCIVFCIIAALVMMQLPSIASALGGGVAIGTLGAVAYAYQKAKGAAGSSKNLITGQTLSDMRGARRARVLNARWASNHPSLGRLAAGAPMAVYRKITGSTNRVSRH
jgi:type IV secretion system protein VirB6